MDIQSQQRINRLVLLYMEGGLTGEQEKMLEEWRAASTGHEKIFQRMTSVTHLEESIRRFVKSDRECEAEWQNIRLRTIVRERKNRWRRVCRYAAIWLLPLLIGGGVFYMWEGLEKRSELPTVAIVPGSPHAILELADGSRVDLKDAVVHFAESDKGRAWKVTEDSLKYQSGGRLNMGGFHTLKVPRGGEYALILADGTKVFLNAESCLKYPVDFTGDVRKVILEGEAYFEVARNPEKPFVVEANRMEVKVLGTCFGIRAYVEEENILATLVSGTVNVNAGGQDVVLKPAQQASFDKKLSSMKVNQIDTELFVGWKDGRLVFDNCPLERILTDLGRWYSFDVFYVGQAAKLIPFSLNIKKHEKFAKVLELMQSTGKVRFDISKNTVVVK